MGVNVISCIIITLSPPNSLIVVISKPTSFTRVLVFFLEAIFKNDNWKPITVGDILAGISRGGFVAPYAQKAENQTKKSIFIFNTFPAA